MAIEFAKYLVWLNDCMTNGLNDHIRDINNIRETTYWSAINAFCKVAQEANPNFDKTYFVDFIMDIVEGRRDTNGKLIKTKKVA